MTINIKYLFIYFKISIVLSLIYIAAFGILLHRNIDIQLFITLFLLCIIPCISSFIMLLIGKHTSLKHPKLTKITANIINLAVFIAHFYYIFIIFAGILAFSGIDDTEYTDIKDYKKALNSYSADAVSHFPKQIPENAVNISMQRSPDSFTGDSDFYLKFDTDYSYIQNEIEKYKNQGKVFIFNSNNNFENNNFDYNDAYNVLNSIVNESTKGWTMKLIERYQCFRGFAVKDNTIIYILSCD